MCIRDRYIVDANMEVASSDDVTMLRSWTRLAEALTCSFISYMWHGGFLHKALSHLAKRDLNVKVGVGVS